MLPCKKAPASSWGRRNKSVATLLAVVTETGFDLLSLEFLSVCDRQPNLYDVANLFYRDPMTACVRLTSDERQRHQRHNRQADNFVEVTFKKGFHRCDSIVSASSW